MMRSAETSLHGRWDFFSHLLDTREREEENEALSTWEENEEKLQTNEGKIMKAGKSFVFSWFFACFSFLLLQRIQITKQKIRKQKIIFLVKKRTNEEWIFSEFRVFLSIFFVVNNLNLLTKQKKNTRRIFLISCVASVITGDEKISDSFALTCKSSSARPQYQPSIRTSNVVDMAEKNILWFWVSFLLELNYGEEFREFL